jgi:16S rRNA (cytosine967-C5)-methyltransferase
MSVAVPKRPIDSREVALQVVRDVFGEHARGAREALDYRARAAAFENRDRGFATELAYGAIKMRRWLDYQLEPFVGARANTMPRPIAEILRLGVYQLRCMNGVETYAAVSESVGLARRYGHKGTAGLVNAVLRRLAEAPVRDAPGDDDDALAIRASLPTWIVAHWRTRFGPELLPAILSGVNSPAAIGLGVNLRRTSREDVLAALAAAGIAASASEFARDAIVLDGHSPASALDRLADGRWESHAEAACFPVDILDPQPGDRIYEACSGRGNKTLQIVERTGATGQLETVDLDERRVTRARERLIAAGAGGSALILVGDATLAQGAPDCDRVLVDAPCSGLGIIGRQPEARWRKDPGDPARLAAAQGAILTAAAGRVKPGGSLVYAVCSTDARESEAVVDAFLAAASAFARAPISPRYAAFFTDPGDVRVPPGIAGRDGFYIARLIRQA